MIPAASSPSALARRRGLRGAGGVAFAAGVLVAASAHLGSPDTWFSGDAGPYRLLVHVRSPAVIPGSAPVEIRFEGASPDEVLVRVDPLGGKAPQPAVRAAPVGSEPGVFQAELRVTAAGPGSVSVQARGPLGEGTAVVPVTFLPMQRVEISGPMAIGLALVATVLLGGLVAGVGAAVRDLPGGDRAGRRRAARVAMAATTAVIAVGLVQVQRWWTAQNAYLDALFRPLVAAAEVSPSPAGAELILRVTDEAWGPGGRGPDGDAPVILDHGKLMHLFVIAEDRSAFAHLHPATSDTVTFRVGLPPLDAGRYLVFAEVTHDGGLARTITAPLEVPPEGDYGPLTDADDSWARRAATPEPRTVLGDGSVLHWERGTDPLVPDVPAPLRFALTDSAGAPLPIEPYMGMNAHAVLLRDDDSVFVHVHPSGTVSAAAQLALTAAPAGDGPGPDGADAAQDPHAMHRAPAGVANAVSFPYAFPSPGAYNLWVQVKHRGAVLTGVFRVEVGPGGR